MINVEMTKSSGVTLATENTICNENVNVTIANSENLIAENIKKDVQIADVVGTLEGGGGDDTALIGLIQRDMTEFVIPNSVTSIGYGAFSNCSKLTSVTIPNSVTSIGNSAFFYCTRLTSIIIPNSIKIIGNNAFEDCYILTSVTIPSSVTSIGSRAFAWCTGLTSVTIPNSITNINQGLFSDCESLTSVTIPNSITSIGNTPFQNCKNLTDVNLENGFNANNLNLSSSTKYTAETIVSWLEALADRTGLYTYKLTIGSTNIAKLTEEQIAIATNKNWTLA